MIDLTRRCVPQLLALKERSAARVKTWGNTLEASRQKLQRERAKRLEEAEAAQVLIDIAEQKLQEANRRAVIDRADRARFEDSDPVKRLASAMLLSDIMVDRDVCRRVKNAIRQEEEATEERFQAHLKAQLEVSQVTEHAQHAKRHERQLEAAVVIRQQKKELEARRAQAIEEERREGDRLRQQAERERVCEEEEDRQVALERAAAMQQQVKANQQRIEEKRLAKLAEVEALEQAKRRSEERQRLTDLLKSKNEERARVKLQIREAINERVSREQRERQAAVEHREELAMQQTNDVEKEREAARKRKQADLLAQMKAQIAAQISDIKARKDAERLENEQALARAIQEAQAYQREEQEKLAVSRQKAQDLAKFHRAQIASRSALKSSISDKDPGTETQKVNAAQDAQKFRQFAKQVTEAYAKEGKSTLPIVLALKRMDLSDEVPGQRQRQPAHDTCPY